MTSGLVSKKYTEAVTAPSAAHPVNPIKGIN